MDNNTRAIAGKDVVVVTVTRHGPCHYCEFEAKVFASFTLASAGTLVGAENVRSATVATPGLPPSINAVVSVDGNAVKVRFKALGLSIIFR